MSRKRDTPRVHVPVLFIEEPCLLTPQDAARLLAVSVNTLHYWRVKGHRAGPDFIRLGVRGRIRYQLQAVRDYVAARRVWIPQTFQTLRIPKTLLERKRRIDEVLEQIRQQKELESQQSALMA
jgi:hypothetical protein